MSRLPPSLRHTPACPAQGRSTHLPGQQRKYDLHAERAAVHKVAVEQVGVVAARQPIQLKDVQQVVVLRGRGARGGRAGCKERAKGALCAPTCSGRLSAPTRPRAGRKAPPATRTWPCTSPQTVMWPSSGTGMSTSEGSSRSSLRAWRGGECAWHVGACGTVAGCQQACARHLGMRSAKGRARGRLAEAAPRPRARRRLVNRHPPPTPRAHLQQYLEGKALVDQPLRLELVHHGHHKVAREHVAALAVLWGEGVGGGGCMGWK